MLDPARYVHKQDVETVTESVFSTMMGLTVRPAEAPVPDPPGLLTAAVRLSGEWEGAVAIHCPARQASEFAARFVGLPASEMAEGDVRDVIGELANMIAGNLKCTFVPGIRLSIPSVTDGAPFSREPGLVWVVHECGFESEEGSFWITLVGTE